MTLLIWHFNASLKQPGQTSSLYGNTCYVSWMFCQKVPNDVSGEVCNFIRSINGPVLDHIYLKHLISFHMWEESSKWRSFVQCSSALSGGAKKEETKSHPQNKYLHRNLCRLFHPLCHHQVSHLLFFPGLLETQHLWNHAVIIVLLWWPGWDPWM